VVGGGKPPAPSMRVVVRVAVRLSGGDGGIHIALLKAPDQCGRRIVRSFRPFGDAKVSVGDAVFDAGQMRRTMERATKHRAPSSAIGGNRAAPENRPPVEPAAEQGLRESGCDSDDIPPEEPVESGGMIFHSLLMQRQRRISAGPRFRATLPFLFPGFRAFP
jgi:hypothetical protein